MSENFEANPLPVADWDDSLSHIINDMKGRPLNVHGMMANHPELLKAWWNFRNYSVTGGELGQRKGELVILRVAVQMKAWYEWSSHVERGLAVGLTLEEIERVKQGGVAQGWAEDEKLLLTAVDELVVKHAISEQTHTDLREYFNVQQIMDMIAILGMYVILGCMINTWGLELDPHVEAKLPASVTKEQFEAGFPTLMNRAR